MTDVAAATEYFVFFIVPESDTSDWRIAILLSVVTWWKKVRAPNVKSFERAKNRTQLTTLEVFFGGDKMRLLSWIYRHHASFGEGGLPSTL